MAKRGMDVSEIGPKAGNHERATASRQAVRVKGNKPVGKGKGKPPDSAGGKGPSSHAGYRAAGGGMSPRRK